MTASPCDSRRPPASARSRRATLRVHSRQRRARPAPAALRADRVRAAVIRTRLPLGQRGVDVGSSLHQPLNHAGAAVGRGQHQGCDAIAIGGVGVRAGTQQKVGNRRVIADRAAQCSGTVPSASRAFTCPGCFSCARTPLLVARPHGVCEARCGGRRADDVAANRQQQRTRYGAASPGSARHSARPKISPRPDPRSCGSRQRGVVLNLSKIVQDSRALTKLKVRTAEDVRRPTSIYCPAACAPAPRRDDGPSQPTADRHERQWIRPVHVRIAHPAAVEDQRVIEQRAVAVRVLRPASRQTSRRARGARY